MVAVENAVEGVREEIAHLLGFIVKRRVALDGNEVAPVAIIDDNVTERMVLVLHFLLVDRGGFLFVVLQCHDKDAVVISQHVVVVDLWCYFLFIIAAIFFLLYHFEV